METLANSGELTATVLFPNERYGTRELPFVDRPLSIERQAQDDDSILYSATWPDTQLVGVELMAYLNATAPREMNSPSGIRDDLALRIQFQTSPYNKDLAARHAASFGRAWDQQLAYAQTVHQALDTLPDVSVVDSEIDQPAYRADTEIFTREQLKAEFNPYATSFERNGFAALYTQHGDLPEYEEVPDSTDNLLRATEEGEGPIGLISVDIETQVERVWSDQAVSQLLTAHPDALDDLFELHLAHTFIKFSVVDQSGRPNFLYGSETFLTRHQLTEMFAEEPLHYDDGVHSFDYMFSRNENDGMGEYIILPNTYRLTDPRLRMQPVLKWRCLQDGRRIFEHQDEDQTFTEYDTGAERYKAIESSKLGLLMAFLFMRSYRQDPDPKLWPYRDTLPADKWLPRGPSMGRYHSQVDPKDRELTGNPIGPANVGLQAVRKGHLLAQRFPFVRLEERATDRAA